MCVKAVVDFPTERIEGEDYKAGFKLFGYSSPFTKPGEGAEVAM
jgi:hypothetical protein